ncbi:3'-N-debenzoyl-2'-deoxytaxol N-benzoyltransferase [Solanum tuberosum]|uniref:10-deacetylbaccatin III 10-O-acetyltransferase n=1 Tax=Solanum tuberosum TaxID=4113 RepID=M1A2Q1_SOLTU|nr:PREDICTED: 3'-N-debenzoyl-2'-deoxytaxol N-benzoyltransferase [Solanum tuberosum]XP_015164972.1 PREDICTED: 3'-N-debenzoyl-2'-deoxytaxol N-benzoyltransferase [Solanum tuberosum]
MVMDFLVTTKGSSGGNFITPSGQTPTGSVLDLSVIDSLAVLRCNARTLHVFKGGNATVIQEAFGKALVPYYPLAGRLKFSAHNNQLLQIDCSGQGIWFVEASADCTLLDVNYFDEASALDDTTFNKLLPQLVHSSTPLPVGYDSFIDPLVLVQVTEFKCGGYVMGLTFCHSICDGLGAAQFLKAVGEFARGVEKLSVAPVWCRELLLPPPQKGVAEDNSSMPPPLTIPVPDQRLEHASFNIPLDEINQLKHQVMQELKMDQNVFCSSFESIAATLWRHRTRAILNITDDKKNPSNSSSNTSFIPADDAGDEEVKLVFFANCRQLVPLPEGFYGNCFFPVTVKASNKVVAEASLAEVVKLIKDAKADLPAEFSQWLNNKTNKSTNDDQFNDPFAPGPGVGYDTLFISEWGRLGFNEVDYGWGKPVHVIPVQGSAVIPVGIVSKQPLPENGIRLMTWCVHSHHLPTFLNMMNKDHDDALTN